MRLSYLAAFFAVCRTGIATDSSTISISPPKTKPHNASSIVPGTFPGYAFEESSFLYFAGNKSHPNKASRNLIKAISDKTQTNPIIRVGGTSLDNARFDQHQSEPIHNPDPTSGIPKNLTIGPSFSEIFGNFPDARYVVDIPWHNQNLKNSLLFAESAYKTIGSSKIYALEVGNEPDNYKNRENWDEKHFSSQWGEWSESISKKLKISLDRPTYQAVALASKTGITGTPGGGASSWHIGDIFKKGGMKQFKQRMKTISMHYYQIQADENSDLQDSLMNHGKVVSGTKFIEEAINNLTTLNVNVPIVLGEVGNTLGNGSGSAADLEGVFGSALWQVDFSLYTMFIGVRGINMQSGTKFPFSLWHPEFNNSPGVVLPAFYAQIFAAEFIGSGKEVTVANIKLDMPHLSAYAAYKGTKLVRLAIVNLELWDGHGSDKPKRPHKNIILDVPSNSEKVTVKRLTSPVGGTAKSSDQITWGGVQWTYEHDGQGKEVAAGEEHLTVDNGTLKLAVNASEAVMVFF